MKELQAQNRDTANGSGEGQVKAPAESRLGGARLAAKKPAKPAFLLAVPTAMHLIASFRRRWFIATTLGLLTGAALGITLWFTAPPQSFTARTLLHVASIQPVILGDTPETRVVLADYQRTQLALAKGRKVLNAALRSPAVRDLNEVKMELDPVLWLEKRIRVDYGVSPEIMRISLSGPESKNVTILVEAVRDAYLNEIVDKEYQSRLTRLELLKELFAQYDLGLKKKREDLRTLANGLGSTNPQLVAVKQEFQWKELYTIQNELLQVQSQIRKARLEVSSQAEVTEGATDLPVLAASTVGLVGLPLARGPFFSAAALAPRRAAARELPVSADLINEYLKKDIDYDRLSKQVVQLEMRRDFLKSSLTNPEKEPSYKRVLGELVLAKKALAICRDEIQPRIARQAREKLLGEVVSVKQGIPTQIEFLTKLETILTKEVEERSKVSQNTSKQNIDLEWLKDDITAVDSTSKRVSGQIENLKVELRAEKRVKSMEDTAVAEDADKRLRTTGIGFLVGLALSILGVSYLEFRARRVTHPEELAEGLQVKLLGTLPVVSRRGAEAEGNRRFQKYLVESVDATRLVLLHAARHESVQVLLTTSAFGGEGKTMLSGHLAVNLATAGYRTLLIDADLRRPSLHKIFNMPNEQGLCEVLRGEVELSAALAPGPVEGLSVLLAGDCKEQPTQLLSRDCFSRLLPTLRQQYDYIVVDSAPLLPVVDSQLIAQHVDGVIMSVIRNVSRLPAVHSACERLVMLDVRILGVVVHGVTTDSYYQDYELASSEAPKK